MKRKATIAGAVICLSVGCLWLTSRFHARREPTYGGKPVSYWARQSRHAVEDDSVRVLRQMGSTAVPYLTNQLTLKDGPLQKSWLWASDRSEGTLSSTGEGVRTKYVVS
jgi:hypothetical protein